MIKLYNTLTRKLQNFEPLRPAQVGIYSCGPTVYWNQHIGNMYCYTQWDVLVRFLRWVGFKVKWVMNITDVGHLTSDQDLGEDKMEKGAQREGVSVWKIADRYIAQFLKSMDLLNIQRPDVLCRATEHIKEQIELIKLIEKNGFTYKTKTGLVFDTAKFTDYAKFSRLDLKKQTAGARVEIDPEKKQPWDFFLWVTNQPHHLMQWDSPWGRGFPGWHIECTAMSTKYLGNQFDIHTGGKEHIPVHHTNEIAQGFGAFGRQTANFWLHNEWLTLKGEKMSKSAGKGVLVTDLAAKGFNPLAFRYLILTSHYKQGLVFDWEALKGARVAYEKLISLVRGWRGDTHRQTIGIDDPGKIEAFRQKFIAKLSRDLCIPEALATVWEMAKSDLPAPDKLDLILDFDKVLGLRLSDVSRITYRVSPKVKKLIAEREELRQRDRWDDADKIRRKIKKLGWQVEDTPQGPKTKPASD